MTSLTAESLPGVDKRSHGRPPLRKVAALLGPISVSDQHLPQSQRRGAAVLAANESVMVIRAISPFQLERAFRLRYRVIVDEMKANPGLSSTDTLERDFFDPYCEHLIAIERGTDRVVATCRLMLPERAAALGCLDSDRRFWLTRLNPIRDEMLEFGRICLTADHRNGVTIGLLWKALLNLAVSSGQRYVVGAASVSLDDGGDLAVRLARHLGRTCMAEEPWRVWPRRRLPMIEDAVKPQMLLTIPPLFKSYLQIGARLLGEPHHDEDFGTAELPVLIDLPHARPRPSEARLSSQTTRY